VKYVVLTLVFSAGYLLATMSNPTVAADPKPTQPPAGPPAVPANPAIDMDGYLKVAQEAAKHRATHRITEDDFIKMSKEKGTIVLDARSKEMYDLLHVEGAINLSFPNIDIESLKKTLPDKDARILIYCNNNFTDPAKPAGKTVPARAFASKLPTASLNISTYIALYNYGYKNVYELAPLVDPEKTKLTLVPTKTR
jgi:phage shock protein E